MSTRAGGRERVVLEDMWLDPTTGEALLLGRRTLRGDLEFLSCGLSPGEVLMSDGNARDVGASDFAGVVEDELLDPVDEFVRRYGRAYCV